MDLVLICLAACFLSTMLGAISGIGGGVLIKPALDLLLPLSMSRISVLSSCAVLCMALFSVTQNQLRKNRQIIRAAVALPLAVGSTAGGVLGKLCFGHLSAAMGAEGMIKITQNALLLLLMLAVLIITLRRKPRGAAADRPPLMGFAVAFALGVLAAFLGIGGGPLNMLALTALYGLEHKEGALYSLVIIVCSQSAALLTALLSAAELPPAELALTACAAGILGGVVGRMIAGRVKNQTVRVLYSMALVGIMILCAINIGTRFL